MQQDRTAGSVRGLGVCDVLRLELLPVQLARLIDELDRRCGDHLDVPAAPRPDEGMDAEHYELWLLRRMRAELPDRDHAARFGWSGPTGLLTDVVRACLRTAAAELAALAADLPRGRGPNSQLAALASEAAAWTSTVLDCAAVESFTFDPRADPARSW
jgi:hypothetical protein